MIMFNIILLMGLFVTLIPFMSPSYGQEPTNNTLVGNSQDNSTAVQTANNQDRTEREITNEASLWGL